MIETYFKLVVAKKRTCDKTNTEIKPVPAGLIDKVRALLFERGYNENGDRIN